MKLCTEFERNRAIRGGVIAISMFDLMTLNFGLRVAVGSNIILALFDLWQFIRAWIITFFLMQIRYITLWSWSFWPVDLKVLDQSLYEISPKWSNPRLNSGLKPGFYSHLGKGATPAAVCYRWGRGEWWEGRTWRAREREPIAALQGAEAALFHGLEILLHFQTRVAQSW